jgi:hypothetical protein
MPEYRPPYQNPIRRDPYIAPGVTPYVYPAVGVTVVITNLDPYSLVPGPILPP